MHPTQRFILMPLAAVLLCAQVAAAGVNAGFVVSVDEPLRIENPAPGSDISVLVRAAGTTEVKGIVIRLLFDPAVVEFVSYTLGDVTPGALALPKSPELRDDGLAEIEGGSTILGAGFTSVTSGGLLGTFQFRMLGSLPDAGAGIWLTSVEVNTSADPDDEDVLTYSPGDLGVTLAQRFANQIFNAEVTRRSDGATVAWESRFVGLADTLRVRATGDSLWRVATAATAAGFDTAVVAAASLGPPYAAGFLTSLAALNRLLLSRRHLVNIDSLAADTPYEFTARSTGLAGSRSNLLSGVFRTRLGFDLRSAAGTDLDVQTTTTSASASWFTNRLADTQMLLNDAQGNEVATIDLDAEGSLTHSATINGLTAATEYAYVVTSRLVGADELVLQGLLTEAQLSFTKTGTFRTPAARQPLRLLAPPAQVVSPDAAVIHFRLNQIALATVSYSEAAAGSPASGGAGLYEFSTSTGDILNEHSLRLSDLTPSTRYRYRVAVVTPDGDSLSTDPRGNQQWSRDLQFTTSAAGDTLPPVIVEGPFVIVRDVLGIVRFVTDVDTRATVFFGTQGGTYGTADEFEIADQTPSGTLRLAQEHSITVSGLQPGGVYDYGIVVEAANGQTASFEPNLPAGKRAHAGKRLKVLQPPGGAGSFTTSNDPDTQFPVILSGPTVSSKTNSTAIVEWTTDEPASSDVQFGLQSIGEARANSGVSRTRHKLVLSNLAAGSPYAFQVGATDAAGNGATTSGIGAFATDPDVDLTAPALTVGPQVIYHNDEVATIQWTTDEDATAQVDFGVDAEVLGFIRTLPTTGTVHEVTLTNLTPSTTYYYQVTSADLSNNGPTQSAVMSLTTDALPDIVAPVIDALVVTAADSSAIVSWRTDELADSFVDLGTVSGLLDQTTGEATDVLAHEVTLTNLLPGTQYFLTAGSSDRSGNGPTETAEVAFTTLTSADTTAPVLPVWQLLGGRVRDRVECYAWIHGGEPNSYADDAHRRLEEGFRTVKFTPFEGTGLGFDIAHGQRAEARVCAVRDAVGSDIGIAIDAHGLLNPVNAVAMARRIAPYGILFYEEPILPESAAALADVRRRIDIPVATGERLFGRHAFRDLLVQEAVDVIQADVGNAGGILEVYKIAAMAEAFYVSLAPHNPWSPLTTAISLHLDAVVPNFLIQEIPTAGAHAGRASLLQQQIESPHDGFLDIPDGPGWGVDLDCEFIKAHPWDTSARRTPWRPQRPDGGLIHS